MQLPLYRASHEFVVLSLDGSRQVSSKVEEGTAEEGTAIVTMAIQLDHYLAHPTSLGFEQLSLCNSIGCLRMLAQHPLQERKRWW